MKKALIIGAGGFVGGYLVDHLQKDCKWSVVITKKAEEDLSASNTEVFELDILDCQSVKRVLNKVRPDYIFHLAAQSSVALSWKDFPLTVDINIKGCINILNAVHELDYKPRILLIGSGEEYGSASAEIPIAEDAMPRPNNPYAVTKFCQNMVGTIYSKAYNLEIIMVRAFNHIGPRQSPVFVVADFCKQVAEIKKGLKNPIIYVGNLDVKRDFTDVRDVVRAYSLLIQNGKSGETYNVGSGKAVSIKSILEQIILLSDMSIEIKVDRDKYRPVETSMIEADISKLVECTNWKRKFTLEATLSDVLEYWLKQY